MRIGLASDSTIRGWSSGEVKKPETVNYKTQKPVIDGLFCEKIFGPVKNNECACGKYKKMSNRGKTCERCEVQVTDNIVRRRLMGHIELDEPVVHIWYYKSVPSKMSIFLNLSLTKLQEIIYYRSYVLVKNCDQKNISVGSFFELNINVSVLTEKNPTFILIQNILNYLLKIWDKKSEIYEEAQEYLNSLLTHDETFFMEEFIQFINENSELEFQTGGLAVESLLKQVNIEQEIINLKEKLKQQQVKKVLLNDKVLRRLEILNNFKKTKQKPEWMLTRTIPVLPPELRPIVFLDGGRPAASGINRLYIELLIRKNRLQKFKEKKAPLFKINELCSLIQEATDDLFDNSLVVQTKKKGVRSAKTVTKSITTNLKGKSGRFRQNLLGKRVDYSAGSVISGGPDLKLTECGLPRDIAIVLFTPMVISKLLEKGLAVNKNIAEKMIKERDLRIWSLLEEVVVDYPVILNRAPTLHRLGIQAFYPKLVRGKAIMLHPLVTTAFNADFDGDRMPVHLPLTDAAKQEAKDILLSDKNILNPRNGQLIVTPTQDIVLGIYYLTFEIKGKIGEGDLFTDIDSVLIAYWNHKISLHTLIFVPFKAIEKDHPKVDDNRLILTTPGKLMFNRLFGRDFPYLEEINWKKSLVTFDSNVNRFDVIADHQIKKPFPKTIILEIINEFLEFFGFQKTVNLLDDLKDLGFKYSTRSGVTISLFDLLQYQTEKQTLFEKAEKELEKIRYFFQIGALTTAGKKTEKIRKWSNIKEKVENQLQKYFNNPSLEQPIGLMVNSGARGSISSFTQLVGMRGLMINTKGQVIDTPIKSSLTEGMSALEYYISTYGARKGMVDTALKTADSGYLTRRLVDATHDVYTVATDCGTKNYLTVKNIYGNLNLVVVPLTTRIYGRFSAENIFDDGGELILAENQLITKKIVEKVAKTKIKEIKIRSVLTCGILRGVCTHCYGLDLAKNQVISKGQAVGVLAAQSIGEPATQLTMRTFHTGGVADVSDITQGLPRVIEIFDAVSPKGKEVLLSPFSGRVKMIKRFDDLSYELELISDDKVPQVASFAIEQEMSLLVKINQKLSKGDPLVEGLINLKKLLKVSQNPKKVAHYIIQEVQKAYYLQGIDISDKYFEIVIKKMLSRSRIIDPGDSLYMFGQELETYLIVEANEKLKENNQKLIEIDSIISGIKVVATKTYSFLSASSFQETTRVLIQAAIENRVDNLYGLKENVIVGNLIPVGTGYVDPEDKEIETES